MEARRSIGLSLLPFLIVIGIYGASFCTFVLASFGRPLSAGRVDYAHLGLASYEQFFASYQATVTLLDTFLMSAYLTAITLLLAYPFAYLIIRTESAVIRRALLFIVMMTFLSGGITRAYAWMVILGNNGLINKVIVELGLWRLPLLYNKTGVIIALVHYLLPYCILTLVGVLQTLPRTVEDAAATLGAGRLRTFWMVTFPLSWRGTVGAGVLTYSVAVSSFLFPLLLGGGKVRFMSNHIYELIFTVFNIPYAAATATVFLASTIALIAVLPAVLGAVVRRNTKAVQK